MTRTAFLLTLIITALASLPAHAQLRVFVSSTGLDTNTCTVTQPCRTFQQAHNTVAANGEIDVLDPAGYGPLTITKGISIQAHGFSGITQPAGTPNSAILINVTTGDPVSLNGLLLDGAGTGYVGINIASGTSVQILNSVIRHFTHGIVDNSNINGSNLLVQDTIASDNLTTGIVILPTGGAVAKVTLNRTTANNNSYGVNTYNANLTTIANSVMSNNSVYGLYAQGGTAYLAKSVISGSGAGVAVYATVLSYGDNYINDNTTPVFNGSLTPVGMQ
jgi:hypothetical protein